MFCPASTNWNLVYSPNSCFTLWYNTPGEASRVMPCQWTSDEQEVVLEVPEENGKGVQDSALCSWRQLFKEMEEADVIDPGINSHDVFSPVAGVDEGKNLKMYHRYLWQLIILWSSGLVLVTCPYCLPFDHRWGPAVYIIKPKATPNYYQYGELATNFKYTNCASVFTVQVTCFMFRFSWYHFSWCEPGQVSSIEIHVHCEQQHHKMPLNYSIENHCLKALDATKTLKRAWRVAYQKESNEPWLSSFESKCCFLFWSKSAWIQRAERDFTGLSPWLFWHCVHTVCLVGYQVIGI